MLNREGNTQSEICKKKIVQNTNGTNGISIKILTSGTNGISMFDTQTSPLRCWSGPLIPG